MLTELNQSLNIIITQTQINLPFLAKFVGLIWFVFVLNKILQNRLLYLGIIPRHWQGLPGIVFAPLLHADFNHLFFNTIPLVVLSNFILIQGVGYFWSVTAFITLCSGFLIWCMGKPGIHIGASALITGYWGFLVTDMVQQGSLTSIILGLVSLYYFAGIFFGIFPTQKGVSWEGHLFGLVAGLLASYLWH